MWEGHREKGHVRDRRKEIQRSGKVNINGFSYNYKKGKSFKMVKIGKQQKEEQGKEKERE